MKRAWRLTIWAVVLCACLASTAIAGAAKAPHGKKEGHGLAGKLDPAFGRHGRVVVAGPVAPAEPGGIRPPQFSAVGGGGRVIVATGSQVRAFRSDGTPDARFGEGGIVTLPVPAGENFHLAGVAIDPKGRVLVAGQTESPGAITPDGFPLPRPATVTVYRLLADGRPDPRFGTGGEARPSLGRPAPDPTPTLPLPAPGMFTVPPFPPFEAGHPAVKVTGLAVDPEGRPLLLGSSAGRLLVCLPANGSPLYYLELGYTELAFAARLTVGGGLDGGFGSGGVVDVPGEDPSNLTALRGGGVAFATNHEENYRERCEFPTRENLWRLHVLGSAGSVRADRPIGTPVKVPFARRSDTPPGVTVDPDGRIVVLSGAILRRFLPDGAPDRSFGPGGEAVVRLLDELGGPVASLAVDSADRPVVAVNSWGAGRPSLLTVTRLTSSGRPDRAFGTDGMTTTKFNAGLSSGSGESGLAVDARDRITVSGRLTCGSTSAACRPFLVRFLGN